MTYYPKTKLQTVNDGRLVYQWKGNRKQKLAMESWLTADSKTFGNLYLSFKNAGFSDSYCKNISNLAPKWISEYIQLTHFTPEHTRQGIQSLAQNAPNSRSPDDTRLKALEVLADIQGLTGKSKGNTTNILVQPILSGLSVKDDKVQVDSTVIDTKEQ
jgi:hypothetical protein